MEPIYMEFSLTINHFDLENNHFRNIFNIYEKETIHLLIFFFFKQIVHEYI